MELVQSKTGLYACECDTVNVVIFAGGKFHKNIRKTFHLGVIFMIIHLFPE